MTRLRRWLLTLLARILDKVTHDVAQSFGLAVVSATRAMSDAVNEDPWRLAEWNALPEVCLIHGCDSDDIDQRGPVWLRDESMHKACREHWEGIMGVLGRQVSWESEAMRVQP